MGNTETKGFTKGKKLLKQYWTNRSALTLSQDARATKKIFQIYAGSQTAIIQKNEAIIFIRDILEVSGLMDKLFEECPSEVGFEDYIDALIESLFLEMDLKNNHTMDFSALTDPELEILPFLDSICQKMLDDPNFSEKVSKKLQKEREKIKEKQNQQKQINYFNHLHSPPNSPESGRQSNTIGVNHNHNHHHQNTYDEMTNETFEQKVKNKVKGKEPLWSNNNNENNFNKIIGGGGGGGGENGGIGSGGGVGVLHGRSDIRSIEINLDLSSYERWEYMCNIYKAELDFLNSQVPSLLDQGLGTSLEKLYSGYLTSLNCRGIQPFSDELKGMSKASGISMNRLIALQLIYDFVCTTRCIVTENPQGIPTHGVCMLLLPGRSIKTRIVELHFTRNGEVVYSGTSFLAYVGLLTGYRRNAYSISISCSLPTDTKSNFPNTTTTTGGSGGNGDNEGNDNDEYEEVSEIVIEEGSGVPPFGRYFRKVMSGGVPLGLLLRHTLEKQWVFLRAVEALSTTKIPRPSVIVVCGSKIEECVILVRKRKSLVFESPLSELQHIVNVTETDYLTKDSNKEFVLNRPQKEILKMLGNGKQTEVEIFSIISSLVWSRLRSFAATLICPSTSRFLTRTAYPLVPISHLMPKPVNTPSTVPVYDHESFEHAGYWNN